MSYSSEVLADSPVSWWRLDDVSTTAADQQAANAGTYSGTYTQGVAGLIADGNAATTFSGGKVSVPLSAGLTLTGSLTIEAWINGVTTDGMVCGSYDSSNGHGYQMMFTAAGTLRFYIAGPGGRVNASAAIGTGTHHVVGTYDGTTLTIYRDGVAIATASQTGGANPTQPFEIAAKAQGTTSGSYNGTVDEVAVYNSTLSAARVLAHYNAGITQFVAATRALKWDIANQISATRTLRWDISNQTAATRTLVWNIDATNTGPPTGTLLLLGAGR